MFEEQDDTILARWLEDKLTLEEQTMFEKSEEFKDYSRIVNGMRGFIKPVYDKDILRNKLFLAKDKTTDRKLVAFKPWYYAVAASILLLLSIGLYFNDVDYIARPGEQLTVALPDGSKVHLNAGSHLKRKRFLWSWDRKVTLVMGEGFFEVEKNEKVFKVALDEGTVEVLGTKFNLRTRKGAFAVRCYEGKIQFEEASTKEKTILVHGQEIIKSKNNFIRDTFSESRPAWMKGTSVFKNVPLIQVIEELEIQYGISFDHELANTSQNFTGSFIHGDLQTALKTVFLPMEIEYSLINDAKTIVLKASD
tara:strand:+ start:272031 stop:272951 length:921 start_codon:yes stop_codon:yes gene_type:complete